MKLSVVIITFNEERNIGRCIDSVKNIADEIIVLDSISSDNTVNDFRKQRRKRYIISSFLGYVEQKESRTHRSAANDYVLCLDADEALDKALENPYLK